MTPTTVEDNTTETIYLAETWNSTNGQLRLSKITGTAAAPVFSGGTQFPQSPFSWRNNAARIGPIGNPGASGGYAPERQTFNYAPSGNRLMNNDARMLEFSPA